MQEYFYEVDLAWKGAQTGTIDSHGLSHIDVVSPIESPKEKSNKWTPEHLLGASLATCFMNNFLEIAGSNNIEVLSYESQCFIKLEKTDKRFVATEILLRPTIQLAFERQLNKANSCIEKAEITCSIRNILNLLIKVHPQFEFASATERQQAS